MAEQGIPSRLAQRAQGAKPQNHPPGVGSALYTRQEGTVVPPVPTQNQDVMEMIEDILRYPDALLTRVLEAKDRAEAERKVKAATQERLKGWLAGLQRVEEDLVDEEVQEDLETNLRDQLRIQPDDLAYEPAQDQARRKALEDQLEPLDFASMLFNDYVEQRIPVRPDFAIVLRTISSEHGLWLMDLASEGTGKTARWYNMMQVAMSLQAIVGPDGKPVPIGRDLSTTTDKESFRTAVEERFNRIKKFPAVLMDDLMVQYAWFTGRVRKLLAGNLAKKVGN